jgi:hypothetical protein
MHTSTKPIGTDASSRPRTPAWFVLLASTPVLCCLGCMLLYIATSPCTLRSQWYDLLGVVPVVPLPTDVQLLSERGVAGKPIFGGMDADDEYYSELYSSPLAREALIAFYEAKGAACSQEDTGTETYMSCTFDAVPFGWGEIAIFSPAVYHTKPMPGLRGDIPSDHLNQAVPSTGTLLRTYVQWCVDR